MTRAVIFLGCVFSLGSACTPPQGQADASSPPAVVMHGVRLRSFEGDTLSLEGQASRATYERSGDLTAFEATIRVPGKAPGDVTVVTARELEGHLGTRQLVATGDVVVRNPSGMVARTPRVAYDAVQQTARGSEGVQVQGPDYRLSAETFLISLPDGQFTFEGSVHTVLEAADD
ncbi:LPS export ABC transporter periplasmic protein LptC [Cystobacter fuscus]|uniref:LPS export ABC transporter periplasmic protein LptC n=1 Tax=Cystobacter fuscus TaxID=43 RepID=UPI0037C11575